MTTSLRNTISELATTFATNVLHAIRGASLEDILSESGNTGMRRGPGRPPKGATGATNGTSMALPTGGARSSKRNGRLSRRSEGDIKALVQQIVGLLQTNPTGLRAEQIREQLGLEAKELPRPLAEALSSRKISKAGQKRATTYFVKGGGGSVAATPKKAGGKRVGKRGGRGKKG